MRAWHLISFYLVTSLDPVAGFPQFVNGQFRLPFLPGQLSQPPFGPANSPILTPRNPGDPSTWRCPPGTPGARRDANGHYFQPPGPNDSRGPCPGLNALANHGYFRRSGKQVNLLNIVFDALRGIGVSPEIGLIVGALGYISKLADLKRVLSLGFDLDELAGHLPTFAIEHDCSFSREDYALGNNNDFNPDLWAVALKELGNSKNVNAFSLGRAKGARVMDEKRRRGFNSYEPRSIAFGAVEVGLILTTLSPLSLGLVVGNSPLEWVRSLFEQERLPCEWAPFPLKTNTITVLALGVESLLGNKRLLGDVLEGIILSPKGILDALFRHRNGTRPSSEVRQHQLSLMRYAFSEAGHNASGVDELERLWGGE
ncbi:hypothetical protein L249_4363 [Ophiocordyceps polyrhachis-furcata BCC 54312]|uniref:Heme haloperoxidase family profile domain-containing protein n=1 Tax=Ophiocordyceps polyrhachis-furcata BCC 54312 TaxID=1330021 RepID=A0A367L7E8_9HYPO|nr:hypothetical protein L249_4363 [Ophiocordyceps polyrhachis-furcata BCC 54312]